MVTSYTEAPPILLCLGVATNQGEAGLKWEALELIFFCQKQTVESSDDADVKS